MLRFKLKSAKLLGALVSQPSVNPLFLALMMMLKKHKKAIKSFSLLSVWSSFTLNFDFLPVVCRLN